MDDLDDRKKQRNDFGTGFESIGGETFEDILLFKLDPFFLILVAQLDAKIQQVPDDAVEP